MENIQKPTNELFASPSMGNAFEKPPDTGKHSVEYDDNVHYQYEGAGEKPPVPGEHVDLDHDDPLERKQRSGGPGMKKKSDD